MNFEPIYQAIKEALDKEIPANNNFIDVCAECKIPDTEYRLVVWGEENDTDDKFFSVSVYDTIQGRANNQLYGCFSESESMADLREGIKMALNHLEHRILNSKPAPSPEERTVTLPPYPVYGDLDHRELLDLIRAYDSYIITAADAGLLTQGWTPVCFEEFYQNEYQNIWAKGGNFDYLYGEDSDFIIPKDRVENARAFYMNGELMCQIDGEDQFRPLRTRIQDIKEGDAFIIECEHPSVYIAKDDAYQNFDEPDEPWIVYDEIDYGWFEEDIADAEFMFRSLRNYTSLEQLLDQALDSITNRPHPEHKANEPDKTL